MDEECCMHWQIEVELFSLYVMYRHKSIELQVTETLKFKEEQGLELSEAEAALQWVDKGFR
jgi:hypothetical protein